MMCYGDAFFGGCPETALDGDGDAGDSGVDDHGDGRSDCCQSPRYGGCRYARLSTTYRWHVSV